MYSNPETLSLLGVKTQKEILHILSTSSKYLNNINISLIIFIDHDGIEVVHTGE